MCGENSVVDRSNASMKLLSPMYGANISTDLEGNPEYLLSHMYGANESNFEDQESQDLLSPISGGNICISKLLKNIKIIDIFILKYLFLHFHN